MQTDERLKRRASLFSLSATTALALLKLAAAVFTRSVSLFTEAAHSAADVLASGLAFASVRAASVPEDEEHPYGHGKIESIAGFGESVILCLVVLYILYESIPRLATPHPVQHANVGLVVMAVSGLASVGIGSFVAWVGDRTGSQALRTNGTHLKLDFWTSLGAFIAIGIVRVTGFQQADAVVAILLALWIGHTAVRLGMEAFEQLIDRRLPDPDLARIRAIVAKDRDVISFHRLRTRYSGALKLVELHVVLPGEWSLEQAHAVADSLEAQIETDLAPAQAMIHVDPFDPRKTT